MIDIGVNLLHGQFDADREAVLARAADAGVEQLILTGTDLDTSRRGAAFVAGRAGAAGGPSLWCTAGVHPHDAKDAPDGWTQTLAALAAQPEVVAIGETGLDFNRDFSPRPVQERVFREHLALAQRLDLPLFVHDRDAGATVAACLADAQPLDAGVVVHCFTGTAEDLNRYLDLGCWIGITGWVCDRRRGEPLRRLVPRIPPDRLMIETDAPFLKPHDAPGRPFGAAPGAPPADVARRRNEPALLPYVARRLAELYDVPEADIRAVTAANARRFFRLP